MRGFLLILFALCIDGVQIVLGFTFAALEFATPVGGAAGGAATAAYLCYATSSSLLSGIYNGLVCGLFGAGAGAVVSTFAVPLGALVDVVISLVFGGLLVFLLASMGMFYPGLVIGAFTGEALPFVDIFPGWTFMVWKCLSNKRAEEKVGQAGGGGVLGLGLSIIPGLTSAGGASSGVGLLPSMLPMAAQAASDNRPSNDNRKPRAPQLITRAIDGIRAPRDNKEHAQAA